MWQQRLCIACMLMHAGGNYRGAARHSEHQRLFRPQPYQQRQHARTRIWNHPLFCLADKNASVTPRKALKENPGLGEKIIKISLCRRAPPIAGWAVPSFEECWRVWVLWDVLVPVEPLSVSIQIVHTLPNHYLTLWSSRGYMSDHYSNPYQWGKYRHVIKGYS